MLIVPKFGEHSRAIEKALNHHHLNQPAAVSDHFIVQGHSFKNIELIPLELDNSHQQWTLSVVTRVGYVTASN